MLTLHTHTHTSVHRVEKINSSAASGGSLESNVFSCGADTHWVVLLSSTTRTSGAVGMWELLQLYLMMPPSALGRASPHRAFEMMFSADVVVEKQKMKIN